MVNSESQWLILLELRNSDHNMKQWSKIGKSSWRVLSQWSWSTTNNAVDQRLTNTTTLHSHQRSLRNSVQLVRREFLIKRFCNKLKLHSNTVLKLCILSSWTSYTLELIQLARLQNLSPLSWTLQFMFIMSPQSSQFWKLRSFRFTPKCLDLTQQLQMELSTQVVQWVTWWLCCAPDKSTSLM